MSSRDPLIKITGVWLPNKGAELMAHAAVAELSARLPKARFCSDDQGPAGERAAIGMPALPRGTLAQLGRALGFGPKVSHAVDISGFAYGDFWGAAKARSRAGATIAKGVPTYLLPQAFGPFTDPALIATMKDITKGARSIAARDLVSQGHLQALGTTREIPLFPDITIGLNIANRKVAVPEGRFGCLVLNAQTVKTGSMTTEAVLALYAQVVGVMRAAKVAPVIVLHEPKADLPLSESLSAACGGLPIVQLRDARDIKAYISRSTVVVTGRFHGLVNGLATGVPSFAVSWSHKYGELLGDFGCPDFTCGSDVPSFIDRIAALLGSEIEQTRLRQQLTTHAAEKKARLAQLWDTVAADIQRT